MSYRDPNGLEIGWLHFAKNAAGFIGFGCLSAYGAFQLTQGHQPGGLFLIAIVMLAALFAAVRSGKRVVLIRRILAARER